MEENQNTNELQPKEVPAAEIKENAGNKISEEPIHSPPQAEKNSSTNFQPESQIPITISEKSETETMEVHKHPHHVSHKKKWNEYLLEFFMLFLAVFLGFVAENQREHVVEHEREKTYASRLLLDLRGDSAIFQSRKLQFEQRQKDQAHFFKTMSNAKSTDSAMFLSFIALVHAWNPEFITATYNQMKTSGGLRYIRHDEVTTELQKYYDVLLPRIDREVIDLRKVFTDLILPYMIKHFRFQDYQDSLPTKYIILNRTKDSDQESINIMGAYGAGWDTVYELHKSGLKETQKLIELIKKVYHLE